MEANWFMAVTLGFITAVAARIGKSWFKRWFNPLSIYSMAILSCSYLGRLSNPSFSFVCSRMDASKR